MSRFGIQKFLAGVTVALATSVAAADTKIAEFPTNGKPRWHVVEPSSAGGLVVVRSLHGDAPLGSLPKGKKVLAFGKNDKVITLAFAGQMGYVSVADVKEANPAPVDERPVRFPGESLDQIVKKQTDERNEDMKAGLMPSLYEIKPSPSPGAAQGIGPGAGDPAAGGGGRSPAI